MASLTAELQQRVDALSKCEDGSAVVNALSKCDDGSAVVDEPCRLGGAATYSSAGGAPAHTALFRRLPRHQGAERVFITLLVPRGAGVDGYAQNWACMLGLN